MLRLIVTAALFVSGSAYAGGPSYEQKQSTINITVETPEDPFPWEAVAAAVTALGGVAAVGERKRRQRKQAKG